MPTRTNPLPSLDRLNELLDYDPQTGVFSWKVTRGGRALSGDVAGNIDNQGYRKVGIDGSEYKAHRLAWLMGHGEDPGDLHINHINSCQGDNRLENLELATPRQNNHHAVQYGARQNGLPLGVIWYKPAKKYKATIYVHGKAYHLGLYDNPDVAAAAYEAVAPTIDFLASKGINVPLFIQMMVEKATGQKLNIHSLRELPAGVRRRGVKFRANILVDGRNQYLGTYDTPQEAGRAYQTAKKVLKVLAG